MKKSLPADIVLQSNVTKLKCGHCQAINWIATATATSENPNNITMIDGTDVDGVYCWLCKEISYIKHDIYQSVIEIHGYHYDEMDEVAHGHATVHHAMGKQC